MANWLKERRSEILVGVFSSLLATLILYGISFVPKLAPFLKRQVPIPVWLIIAALFIAGLITSFHRKYQAVKRAQEAESFDSIVRKLDARERSEREQVNPEAKKHAGKLALYKAQVRGAADLSAAAWCVTYIHRFFSEHPEYLNEANIAFLERYPRDLPERIRPKKVSWAEFRTAAKAEQDASAHGAPAWSLEELKHEVQALFI